MPVIEIKTVKKYEEDKKISILKDIDKNLLKNLNMEESRFLINWSTFESSSFLFKGTNAIAEDKEYPIIHIYTIEGKAEEFEKTLMETVTKTLAEGLNIDYKIITTILHRISSGNIYTNDIYLHRYLQGE